LFVLTKALTEAFQILALDAGKAKEALEKLEEVPLTGVAAELQAIGKAQKEANKDFNDGNISLAKRNELLDDLTLRQLATTKSTEEFANSQKVANIELRKGANAIRAFDETAQATRGVAQFLQNISDISGLISSALTQAFDQATDALAEFVITGVRNTEELKKAFSDLLRDLAKQIIKVIIQTLILKAIQISLSGFGGGVVASIPPSAVGGGIAGLQAGGPVRRGVPVPVGERGPELFVPTQQGNIIPSGQMEQQPPVVNVINISDPDEAIAAINSAEGEKAILNVMQKNRGSLRSILA